MKKKNSLKNFLFFIRHYLKTRKIHFFNQLLQNKNSNIFPNAQRKEKTKKNLFSQKKVEKANFLIIKKIFDYKKQKLFYEFLYKIKLMPNFSDKRNLQGIKKINKFFSKKNKFFQQIFLKKLSKLALNFHRNKMKLILFSKILENRLLCLKKQKKSEFFLLFKENNSNLLKRNTILIKIFSKIFNNLKLKRKRILFEKFICINDSLILAKKKAVIKMNEILQNKMRKFIM